MNRTPQVREDVIAFPLTVHQLSSQYSLSWREGQVRTEQAAPVSTRNSVHLPAISGVTRDSPGVMRTGVGCHFFLQGIFPTQGSNLCLLLVRWILYHWATWEPNTWILNHPQKVLKDFKLMKSFCIKRAYYDCWDAFIYRNITHLSNSLTICKLMGKWKSQPLHS